MTRLLLSTVAILAVLSFTGCAGPSQHAQPSVFATASTPSMTLTDRVVEVGCAQCMFGKEMPDCETAIRVDGMVFMAEGKDIPDAEDHATGVCKMIKKARVSGKTEGATFVATKFEMLP